MIQLLKAKSWVFFTIIKFSSKQWNKWKLLKSLKILSIQEHPELILTEKSKMILFESEDYINQ